MHWLRVCPVDKQYLDPFLASFPLTFNVKSQVVYLAPLNIPAAETSGGSPDDAVYLSGMGNSCASEANVAALLRSMNLSTPP